MHMQWHIQDVKKGDARGSEGLPQDFFANFCQFRFFLSICRKIGGERLLRPRPLDPPLTWCSLVILLTLEYEVHVISIPLNIKKFHLLKIQKSVQH